MCKALATPLASAALPGVGSSPSAPMVRGLQAGITQRQSPVHDVQGTRYPVGFGGVARRRVVALCSDGERPAGRHHPAAEPCLSCTGHGPCVPTAAQQSDNKRLTSADSAAEHNGTSSHERCRAVLSGHKCRGSRPYRSTDEALGCALINNNVTSNASQNSLLHLEEDRKKAQARPQSRPRIVGRVYWAWARSSSSPPYRDPTREEIPRRG